MRRRFPRNSCRALVSVTIFCAMLGIRLGPWPVDDEPAADEPIAITITVPVLPGRVPDSTTLEAIVPAPRPDARVFHHTTARHHPPPPHLEHHVGGFGHS
jgi:hypothetical protein